VAEHLNIGPNAPLGVAGCGNTGSAFVSLIPGLPGTGHVYIADFDAYEQKNLVSQRMLPEDVGQPKAITQARWLAKFAKRQVTAFVGRFEDLPWGLMRGGILVSCVDSRGARLNLNRMAWRLGIPLVDVAVDGPDLLARVNIYVPGDGAPCAECAWYDAHYMSLLVEYHCDGTAAIAATNSPSALGSLAAALQAIEVGKLLGDRLEESAANRQVLVDARRHDCTVTRFTRNPECRFDHQHWDIRPLDADPAALTLEDVFACAAIGGPVSAQTALTMEPQRFTRGMTCTNGCGRADVPLQLVSRLSARETTCPGCGKRRVAAGFDLETALPLAALSAAEKRSTLAQLGLRPGDVFTLEAPDSEAVHLQLTCGDFLPNTGERTRE